MFSFDVCISKIRCQDLPTVATRKCQVKGLASNSFSVQSNQVEEFFNIVGVKGYSFCPSTFKDAYLRNDTFKQAQLFPLFFDNLSKANKKYGNKFAFHDIEERAKQYHLPIFFAYDVFSSFSLEPNRHMFCVVFLNEIPIFRLKEAEAMQKALLTIFPEADREYGHVTDLYFGGNKVLYFDKNMATINPDIVFMNMCLYLRNKSGSTNYKRKIASFAEETGILLDSRNLPVVSLAEDLEIDMNFKTGKYFDENPDGIPHQKNDKKSPKPTIYKEGENGEKLSRLTYTINLRDDTDQEESHPSDLLQTSKKHLLYRSDVMKSIGFQCKLYHEFESATTKRKLSYQELLGLVTNLAHIESGRKTFAAILKSKSSAGDYKWSIDDWTFYFYYVKQRNPYPCSSFCPYHETCTHGRNILSTCSIRPHQIEKVSDNEDQLVELDEATEDFKKAFNAAIKSCKKIWHIIRSQTALGKTQTILELLIDYPGIRVLIVVPTNKLKREIAERAKAMGIHLAVSPSLHEMKDVLSEEVWEEIKKLLDAGKSPIPYIHKVIENGEKSDAKLLKEYLTERDNFYGSNGCAITTHRRLASIDLSKYDFVIIDEDYIFSTILMDRTQVSLKDLKKLKNKLPTRDSLRAKIKRIQKMSEFHEFFIVDKIDYDKSYANIHTKINIRALCEGTHFCCREGSDQDPESVIFTKRPSLPDGVKFIMLSATANKKICHYCFGEENVKFYNCKEARLTGTLNQYYERPMSRAYLDEHPEVMAQIKAWTGFEHTITFKKYTNYCTDGMYYGNCIGCDVLKGQNIDVIGTPHQPDWVYKLFAFMLGFEVAADLNPCSSVTHNGYRFRFATFDDEILRMIQLYIIETDLEQAVGRARLLRCDATVNLFSNFPLRQAILKESEYDRKQQDT